MVPVEALNPLDLVFPVTSELRSRNADRLRLRVLEHVGVGGPDDPPSPAIPAEKVLTALPDPRQPVLPGQHTSPLQSPVLVIDGDHDEAIKRAHTEYIAATIPDAGVMILPNTSHFAFLQDPALFNMAVLHFLGDR